MDITEDKDCLQAFMNTIMNLRVPLFTELVTNLIGWIAGDHIASNKICRRMFSG
jgi:hypothetical protein